MRTGGSRQPCRCGLQAEEPPSPFATCAFADRRVNFVNERREFFFATPAEVREVLRAKVDGLLEYVEAPQALEYHQSRSRWGSAD